LSELFQVKPIAVNPFIALAVAVAGGAGGVAGTPGRDGPHRTGPGRDMRQAVIDATRRRGAVVTSRVGRHADNLNGSSVHDVSSILQRGLDGRACVADCAAGD